MDEVPWAPSDALEEIMWKWTEEDGYDVDEPSRKRPRPIINDKDDYDAPPSSQPPAAAPPPRQWLFRNTPGITQKRISNLSSNERSEINHSMILHEHLVSSPGETIESLMHDVHNWSLSRQPTGSSKQQQQQRRRKQCQQAQRQVIRALLSGKRTNQDESSVQPRTSSG